MLMRLALLRRRDEDIPAVEEGGGWCLWSCGVPQAIEAAEACCGPEPAARRWNTWKRGADDQSRNIGY